MIFVIHAISQQTINFIMRFFKFLSLHCSGDTVSGLKTWESTLYSYARDIGEYLVYRGHSKLLEDEAWLDKNQYYLHGNLRFNTVATFHCKHRAVICGEFETNVFLPTRSSFFFSFKAPFVDNKVPQKCALESGFKDMMIKIIW